MFNINWHIIFSFTGWCKCNFDHLVHNMFLFIVTTYSHSESIQRAVSSAPNLSGHLRQVLPDERSRSASDETCIRTSFAHTSTCLCKFRCVGTKIRQVDVHRRGQRRGGYLPQHIREQRLHIPRDSAVARETDRRCRQDIVRLRQQVLYQNHLR